MIKARAYVSRLIQRALCSSSFACGRVKNALAQAKRLWRRLHILIDVDVFDRALQTHSEDSFKLDSFAVALAAHVREVLFLAWIDWQIFRTPVFAHDHSFVNILLGPNEKTAALLNVVDCISSPDPGLHRAHHTAPATAHIPFN